MIARVTAVALLALAVACRRAAHEDEAPSPARVQVGRDVVRTGQDHADAQALLESGRQVPGERERLALRICGRCVGGHDGVSGPQQFVD